MSFDLKIAGINIFEAGQYDIWSREKFMQKVHEKYGEGLIKDVCIEKLNQDTETTNELFSTIESL